MHYIHTVRTYIFTYILSRYLHFICLSVYTSGKVQYLFVSFSFLILYEFRSPYLVFSPDFLSPSSLLFLSG